MEKISAVIITYNEERNIERCIKSLQDVVDEIIVIDSYSTDSTEEICKNLNVKFIQTQWLGYSDTKNYGNSLTANNYIFSIDADEALSEELKSEILIIKHSEKLSDAYYVNRLTNYCGSWIHHCGWYPDTKLRLWNKQKGKWQGDIHEEVVMNENSTTSKLNGNLLHYSYYSIYQHLAQVNKFTDLTAQDAFNKGKKASLIKIIFRPVIKFKRDYFLKLGLLDGYHGFIICAISAFATFVKYLKLRELNKLK